MVYELIYRKPNRELETTEWITPAGWDEQRIRKDFEERFNAQVFQIQPLA